MILSDITMLVIFERFCLSKLTLDTFPTCRFPGGCKSLAGVYWRLFLCWPNVCSCPKYNFWEFVFVLELGSTFLFYSLYRFREFKHMINIKHVNILHGLIFWIKGRVLSLLRGWSPQPLNAGSWSAAMLVWKENMIWVLWIYVCLCPKSLC